MKEILEPSITHLSEQDQQKVMALLTKEKAELEGDTESRQLFERLMDYL